MVALLNGTSFGILIYGLRLYMMNRVVKTSGLIHTTGLQEEDSPILVYHENDVPFLYQRHPLEPDMAGTLSLFFADFVLRMLFKP